MIVSEHVSPDATLRLVVHRDETGDLTIGFRDYQWHTHADVLAELSGLPLEQAVDAFVASILNGTDLIAISSIDGVPTDVWVCDDSRYLREHLAPSESMTFRRWNGDVVAGIEE